MNRVTVTLDDAHAVKLRRLAERTHTDEETLAGSLLASALDEADPDSRQMAELLDGIPGAFERAQRGREQARAGLGAPLEDV
jgi:predicted transcriptional regulator